VKYIQSKIHGIVMFEGRLRHDAIAAALNLKRDDVQSAGFVDISPDGIFTYGKSEALDLPCLPSAGVVIAANMRICRTLQCQTDTSHPEVKQK
jgi:hypothetical protein